MEDQLKDRIILSGLKKKHLAEKIGVSANYLSMCLNGRRNLSEPKLLKLKKLLKDA